MKLAYWIYKKIDRWNYSRQVAKAKEQTEIIAAGFWELYTLSLTAHGRELLTNVVEAVDEGDIEVDPHVVSLYRYLLLFTPYKEYAIMN